jgi:beta-lactamase regulating signal transducer with metallopeptidase domain/HEAT repeat protein
MSELLEHPLVVRLGWTLLHSLWQGAVIGALAAVALRLLRRRSAQARYLAGCAALLVLAMAPLATFLLLEGEPGAAPTVQAPAEVSPVPPNVLTSVVAPPAEAASSGRLPLVEAAEMLPEPAAARGSESDNGLQHKDDTRPAISTWLHVDRLRPALPWLGVGWLIGVALLSIRLGAIWLKVRRLTWAGLGPVAEPWPEKLQALAGRLGLWQSVRLFRSALVEMPTVIGWVRPVLLLPASALTGLPPRQLEAILAHELAHVRRHDYLVNFLQCLVEILLFYHPAVWWLSRYIRRERESCCDDLAVQVCGDRLLYARALLTLEETRQAPPALSLAAGGGVLLERIRRLLGVALPRTGGHARQLAGGAALASLLALAMIVSGLGWATGEFPGEPAAVKDSTLDIVQRLRRNEKPDHWHYMGGSIVFRVSGFLVFSWEANRLPKLRDEPDVKALLAQGPAAAPILNKALKDLPAHHPAAERLAFVLGRLGNKESVPVLVDLLRRADTLRNNPKDFGAWEGIGAAALSGLWELTGRVLDQDSAAWQKWWGAVGSSFVPARERATAMVSRDQVKALVGLLPDKDTLIRERLTILGPNAVRYLLESLKTTAGPVQYQLAWVIDELGGAARMPADLRRQYFIERLSDDSVNGLEWDRVCTRAISEQSFADFCRTAIAVDRARAGKANQPMWGVIKSLMRGLAQALGDGGRNVPPALPVILEALDDRQMAVRRVAVELGGAIGMWTPLKPPELIKALERRWLSEPDDWLRAETAVSFSRFDTPVVRRAIRRELQSMNEAILADSLYIGLVLGDFFTPSKDPDVFKRYLELTSHANDRVRSTTVRALSHRAPAMLEPHAQRLANDRVSDVRWHCAFAMGRRKNPAHLNLLLGLIKDANDQVRERAFDSLGDPAFAAGLPRLVPFLKDQKEMYRAQWAIVGMGGRPALAALMTEYRQGNTIGNTITGALTKLTGKSFKTKAEWLAWWVEQEQAPRPDKGKQEPAGGGAAKAKPLPAARVTLTTPRQEYFLGENILVHYRLENTGKEAVRYEKGGFFPELRRNDGYRVSAVLLDKQGRPTGEAAPAIPEPPNFGGPVTHWELPPGKVYEQTLYLPRYLRFEKPGRYRIRVANVVRLEPTQELSAGEMTLTVKLPTPAEARAIYQKVKKLPAVPVAASGERSDTEIRDFQALLHPVYLPVLAEQAAQKDGDALAGMGQIHTADATAALVKLIDQAVLAMDLDFALLVYRQVADRLPNPRWYQYEKTNPVAHKHDAARRAFVERVWRAEFARGVRRLASRLSHDPKSRGLGDISYILECVGVAEDLPDLMRGYTKSIEATRTLPFETHQYFRPRGSAYGYRFATMQLLGRGARVPVAPETPGEAAVYFLALSTQKDFRPPGWQEQAVRWLKHDTPYLREFVLDHLPEPIPEAALKMLPELLTHHYVDLQIAACHTARKHPRPACRQPLLTILRTGKEEHLLNAATAAGPPNGITNDQILEIWLGRLGNDDLGGSGVVRLLLMTLGDDQGRAELQLSDPGRAATIARWGRFIEQNRQKLRRGQRFRIGDPEITPDLFPPGFQFYHKGQLWPAGNEGK